MAAAVAPHPLDSLPTAAIVQWIHQPHSFGERLREYVMRTRPSGKNRFALWLGNTLAFTLDQVTSFGLTCKELFSSSGVGASLQELLELRIVTTLDDLVKLDIQAGDLLGPFESAERHRRLSVTALATAFGDKVPLFVRDTFQLKPAQLLRTYGTYLYPSDFHALALRFDGQNMRHPSSLAVMRALVNTHNMFKAFPYEEWQSLAGLDDVYLGLLAGTTADARAIAALRERLWPTQQAPGLSSSSSSSSSSSTTTTTQKEQVAQRSRRV